MKKVFVTMLLAIVTLFCVACSAESKTEPKYYTPFFDSLVKIEQISGESTQNKNGDNLNDSERSKCDEVFERINQYYELEIPKPSVKKSTFEDFYGYSMVNSIDVVASYDEETKTIFLFNELNEYNVSVLAHEYIHYVADMLNKYNTEYVGFVYAKNEYIMGRYFSEGACNYISTRVYPHPDDTSVYEYETHVASLFATTIGEKEFANTYFSGDLDMLRVDFNQALEDIYPYESFDGCEWEPFDTFIATQETYFHLLSRIDENPEVIIPAIFTLVNSMEETMFIYGEQKDLKKEFQEIIRMFIKNSYRIDWAGYSQIQEIADI